MAESATTNPQNGRGAPAVGHQIASVTKQLGDLGEDIDRLPRRPLQWFGLMMAAAFVGAMAGLVGGLFRLFLGVLDHQRTRVVLLSHAHSPHWIGWIIPAVVCAVGAGIGLWLTQWLAPQTAGSGIPRVEAVLRDHLRPAAAYILPVKFIGGALSIGAGLALGREGPTVQMGGTVGRLLADRLERRISEPWSLIAAGAGAGLAVAFNAPLAAAIFVMEELLHRFSARSLSATLVACLCGTLVLRAIIGPATDFSVVHLGKVPSDVLPEYFILGAAAGLLGVAFNAGLMATLRLFDHARHWPRGTKAAAVGAAVGLIAWFWPSSVGGGERIAEQSLHFMPAFWTVIGLLALRFGMTLFSYGCGSPGGIFAPLLALGALLGNFAAILNVTFRHSSASSADYSIVAMAALFTAVVRSPLTGVVLLLEMTGGWTLILPMLAASVTAYAVPEILGCEPIYDSLRQRDVRLEEMERSEGPGAAAQEPKK